MFSAQLYKNRFEIYKSRTTFYNVQNKCVKPIPKVALCSIFREKNSIIWKEKKNPQKCITLKIERKVNKILSAEKLGLI